MELLSLEFVTALSAVVVIDLTLAGDNAIVIALAARDLPRQLQTRAMVWGTVGAIFVRTTMTIVVVWLLELRGLHFAGGVALLWIAHKLLRADGAESGRNGIAAATTFSGAIKTIIAADMIMGLDNMLAVAGAAHGSLLVVGLGLLVSVPIVIGGSTLLMRFMERFPAVVYVGAAVVAATAVKMIITEPYVGALLAGREWAIPLLYMATVLVVIGHGVVLAHRALEAKTAARLAQLGSGRNAAPAAGRSAEGDAAMKILVPIDHSGNALAAVRRALDEAGKSDAIEIHLLAVQPALLRCIAQFFQANILLAHHRDETRKVLEPIERMLDARKVSYMTHTIRGDRAGGIIGMARTLGCDRIVIATARRSSFTRMIEDFVIDKVLEGTTVPVDVVAGDGISSVERYGLPAGVAAVLMLLLFVAAD